MNELDRNMLRVARAAAVPHHPELMTVGKAGCHFLAQFAERIRILVQEFLFDLNGLLALAHHHAAPVMVRRRTVAGCNAGLCDLLSYNARQ